MLSTLWLVRHGETGWNAAGRLQGHVDEPLNERGWQQARQVAARLAGEHLRAPFAAIFSSDLSRARQTAEETARALGLPIVTRADLRERNFGALSGLTRDEARPLIPTPRDPDHVPEGGESLRQLLSRSVQALEQVAAAWPGAHVLVFTHGGVVECAWRAATQTGLETKRDHPLLNASINRVRVEGSHFELAGWGDVKHLEG